MTDEKLEELARLSHRVASQYRAQKDAREQLRRAAEELARIAGVAVSDLLEGSERRLLIGLVERLRAKSDPRLDAAARLVELLMRR